MVGILCVQARTRIGARMALGEGINHLFEGIWTKLLIAGFWKYVLWLYKIKKSFIYLVEEIFFLSSNDAWLQQMVLERLGI